MSTRIQQLTNQAVTATGAKRRRAASAVEFALTTPLILLVALASADFGRIAYFHQVVCNAARTGAETGAMRKFTTFTRSDWEGDIEQAVLREMQNLPEFDSGELSYVLSTTTDSDDLARINVRVQYPFRTVVAWPALPSEVMLQKSVTYRQFR